MILFGGAPNVLKFGDIGITSAQIATLGDFSSPLLNDPDLPGDAGTELIWALLPPLPSSGTIAVDDFGGFEHVGAADGVYVIGYRAMWMPTTGSPGQADTTITVTFGSPALVGAPSTQDAGSGTGSVVQTHQLTGASSSQSASSGLGAEGQTHVLAGSTSSQPTSSGTGAVTQTHSLTAAPCLALPISGTGAVSTGSQIVLVGAGVSQSNQTSPGAVQQTYSLAAAPPVQSASVDPVVIHQVHVLLGSNCTQASLSSSGSLSGFTYVPNGMRTYVVVPQPRVYIVKRANMNNDDLGTNNCPIEFTVGSSLDYTMDWTQWLPEGGAVLADAVVEPVINGNGVEVSSTVIQEGKVSFLVTGVPVNTKVGIKVSVTTYPVGPMAALIDSRILYLQGVSR